MRSLGRLPVGLGSSNKRPWHTNQRLCLRFTRSKRPYSSSSLLLRLPFELSRYSNKHQHAEKLSKTHHTHTHTHKQTRGLPGSLHLSFRLLLCPPMRASSQAISLGGAQTVGQSIGGVKRCTLWAECATLGAGLAISSRLRCSPRVSRPIDTLLSSGFLSAAESYVSRRP